MIIEFDIRAHTIAIFIYLFILAVEDSEPERGRGTARYVYELLIRFSFTPAHALGGGKHPSLGFHSTAPRRLARPLMENKQ